MMQNVAASVQPSELLDRVIEPNDLGYLCRDFTGFFIIRCRPCKEGFDSLVARRYREY